MQLSRYQRNYKTITIEEQSKLADSTVAVVGCGGLGGYISEQLCRLGVGNLILIDGDQIEESNLNRQLFATENNIGELKIYAARDRLQAVNSSTRLKLIGEFFNEGNAADFLQDANVVCDALDTINGRISLEKACHLLGLPLVYGSIAGWYGQIGVSFPGDYSLARVFPQGDKGMEKVWGNPAFTPAIVASLIVTEAVKILLGKKVTLRHSWLQVDLLEMEFERFALS